MSGCGAVMKHQLRATAPALASHLSPPHHPPISFSLFPPPCLTVTRGRSCTAPPLEMQTRGAAADC